MKPLADRLQELSDHLTAAADLMAEMPCIFTAEERETLGKLERVARIIVGNETRSIQQGVTP